MKQFYFISILLVILLIQKSSARKKSTNGTSTTTTNRGCKITLPGDIPENEPVYLIQNRSYYQIYFPTGKDNFIKKSNSLTLFCPGNKNKLVIGDVNITDITCNANSKFEINSNEYEFNLINCTKETNGDIRITNRNCASNRGGISEIGFKLTRSKFVKLFEVCYDNSTGSVIYSKHKINGKAIKFNVREGERRDFKSTGIPQSAKPSLSYKKTNQEEHFKNILGPHQTFINSTSFLSRGHMTPDADFIFTTAQFATYFYVNVAPQFQIVNAGNWLKVENLARNLAKLYSQDLLIYTGSYQQLELPNSGGVMTPLWLESDEKIEVPKWLWKVIIHENMNAALVLITLNNPFEKFEEINEFCENVCGRAGLDSGDLQRMNKGYTFCCELDDFKHVVKALPDTGNSKKLLECASVKFN